MWMLLGWQANPSLIAFRRDRDHLLIVDLDQAFSGETASPTSAGRGICSAAYGHLADAQLWGNLYD